VRIRFKWFPDNFNPSNNLITEVLTAKFPKLDIVYDNHAPCDLEVVSVFKPLTEKIKDRYLGRTRTSLSQSALPWEYIPPLYNPHTSNFQRRIWYTSENLRPPVQAGLDGSISFDQDELRGFNLYCPSWYEDIGLTGPKSIEALGVQSYSEDLLTKRTLKERKTKFACVVLKHPNAFFSHSLRFIGEVGKVDIFNFDRNFPKVFPLLSDYRFVLCFENDLYPGYVTKMLLHGYLAGSVPIYWGDLGSDNSINRASFLNMRDSRNVREFVAILGNLTDERYREVFEQPFLSSVPSVSKIAQFIIGSN